jgi:D-methionine transport system permease protein
VPFAIFAITIASLFAISRIVEQNLLTVRPGVIEAARAAERAGRGSCSA